MRPALLLALVALAGAVLLAPPALADDKPCIPPAEIDRCVYGWSIDVCDGFYHKDFCIYGP